MRDLSPAEENLLEKLGQCADLHANLPVIHESDMGDFVFHIHALQNVVLARPATAAEAYDDEPVGFPDEGLRHPPRG